MTSLPEAGFLLAAGLLAGVLGTAGGITSLISYPALLAVGLGAFPANVVNLVAAVACWPGAALTSRRELVGMGPFLTRGLPVAAVGAGLGSGLLLLTPAGVFARVVPFLIAAGSLILLAQPRLTGLARQLSSRGDGPVILLLVGLVSIYSGYFGAGSGILLLAVTLTLLDPQLPRANAAKNMLLGASAVTSAALFLIVVPVDWTATVPLAAGFFAGSLVGPLVARRLPARVVRIGVAGLGLVFAGYLWLDPS